VTELEPSPPPPPPKKKKKTTEKENRTPIVFEKSFPGRLSREN